MSIIVSCRAVADEVDLLLDDSWKAYINRRTGELFTVSPDDALAAEGDDDLGLPDWQREGLPKVREVLGSGDWLRLPSKFDIHEYNIMRQFCDEVDDGERREALQDAIRGRGAFRRFKDLAHRYGIEQQGHDFRIRQIEDIVAAWLDARGLQHGP